MILFSLSLTLCVCVATFVDCGRFGIGFGFGFAFAFGIGVGFEMHSDSGLSTVLTGTYGNTHTMYLQTANNTKYLYLP